MPLGASGRQRGKKQGPCPQEMYGLVEMKGHYKSSIRKINDETKQGHNKTRSFGK